MERMGIGERIRHLRGVSTIQDFADSLNVHKSTLVRYEKEESHPDAVTILRICDKYNVNPNWLLTGEGVKEKQPPPLGYSAAHNELRSLIGGRIHDIAWRFAYYGQKESSDGLTLSGEIGNSNAIEILKNYINGNSIPPEEELKEICRIVGFDYNLVRSDRNPGGNFKLESLDYTVKNKINITDPSLLKEIIKIVEDLFKKYDMSLSLDKKAELITLLYEDSYGKQVDMFLLHKKSERLFKLAS